MSAARPPTASIALTSRRAARPLAVLLFTGSVGLSAACGDPDDVEPTSDVAFVVSPWVFSGDESVAYVAGVSAIDGGEVALDQALEYPGGATVFGPPGEGVFFVAPYAAPVVERWTIDDAGGFAPEGTVSFANLGIADAGGTQIFSQGKAYFLAGRELVVWDPAAMELLGTVELPALAPGDDGFEPSAGLVALRDDAIMVYAHWSDPGDWIRWAEHSTQVVVDTLSDEVTSSFDEPRCEMLEPFGIRTSDGRRYFSSDPAYQLYGVASGDAYGTRPCGLRVLDPDGGFDPDFHVDPSALVGDRPAGTITMVSDDTAFVDVFHTDLVDPITPENVDAISAAPAYRFWIWHLGADQAEDVVEQVPRTSSSLWQLQVDGRVFAQDHDPDYATWTLLELRPDGTVRPGLTGAGYATTGVVQVR